QRGSFCRELLSQFIFAPEPGNFGDRKRIAVLIAVYGRPEGIAAFETARTAGGIDAGDVVFRGVAHGRYVKELLCLVPVIIPGIVGADHTIQLLYHKILVSADQKIGVGGIGDTLAVAAVVAPVLVQIVDIGIHVFF